MGNKQEPALAGQFVIRIATLADLSGFLELSTLTGPGFTSLPPDEGNISTMLKACRLTARGSSGVVMLALEDRFTGKIAGCAAVKRGGKKKSDFVNFKAIKGAEGTAHSISVCDDYNDLTEIGGLFVHPEYRRMGVGRWLAQARYLFIATCPETFGATVFAELRGVILPNGQSPFYDSACKPFLHMEFEEADRLCSQGENAKLVAMLPKGSISTETFTQPAMAAIGACHAAGYAARSMLEQEGFHYHGVIDLLDGGALVCAPTTSLRTLETMRMARVRVTNEISNTTPALLSTVTAQKFRCIGANALLNGNIIYCNTDDSHALDVKEDDIVRVAPR